MVSVVINQTLKLIPLLSERVKKVKDYRKKISPEATRKLGALACLFGEGQTI